MAEVRRRPASAATRNVTWGRGFGGVSEGWDQGQESYSYATHTRRSANGTAVQANRSQSSEGRETGVETSETAVAFRWVISGVCGKNGVTAPSSWELGSAPMTHRREDFLGFSCHSFVSWGGRGFRRGEGTAWCRLEKLGGGPELPSSFQPQSLRFKPPFHVAHFRPLAVAHPKAHLRRLGPRHCPDCGTPAPPESQGC